MRIKGACTLKESKFEDYLIFTIQVNIGRFAWPDFPMNGRLGHFLRLITDLLHSKVFYIKLYAINGMMGFVEDRCIIYIRKLTNMR